VQEGVAAGVPLLLCPQIFEQALNADVVVGQGAGLRLRPVTADSIRDGAATLLADGSYRQAAQRLAAELRAGQQMDEAVELLAGLASERAGRAA